MNTHSTRPFAFALTFLLVMAVFDTSARGQATFQGLGDLPGSIFRSQAFGVSADGLVVVGLSYSTTGVTAFRWTSGGGWPDWAICRAAPYTA